MKLLAGLAVLGMSILTAQAMEIAMVRDPILLLVSWVVILYCHVLMRIVRTRPKTRDNIAQACIAEAPGEARPIRSS
jgi:hypothetical protein